MEIGVALGAEVDGRTNDQSEISSVFHPSGRRLLCTMLTDEVFCSLPFYFAAEGLGYHDKARE